MNKIDICFKINEPKVLRHPLEATDVLLNPLND